MINKQAPEGQKLKIRRSPPRQVGVDGLNFTTDMKRLGIMADVQDVQDKKKKLLIKQRHISPPPNLSSEVPAKVGDMSSKVDMPAETSTQFKFPFQRRARSLSLPKDKEGNDIQESQYDSSKPIVAKDNFLVAHKNLVPGVMKLIQ